MQHLYFMLRIRTDQMKGTKTFVDKLPARKLSMYLDLHQHDLMRVDGEGNIYVSEKGDKVLDEVIYQFAVS